VKEDETRSLAAMVDARLRAACDWDRALRSSVTGVDMSAEAITNRLKDCAQMSTLCRELGARDC
jgi:hypothetical protein